MSFKVICIDASDTDLTEREKYEVIESDNDSYFIREHKYDSHAIIPDFPCSYYKWRFIPISTIDERELLEQRQTQLA